MPCPEPVVALGGSDNCLAWQWPSSPKLGGVGCREGQRGENRRGEEVPSPLVGKWQHGSSKYRAAVMVALERQRRQLDEPYFSWITFFRI